MKINVLLTALGLLFLAFLFYGSSSGAALIQAADRTGSPVGSGSCATCHSGGNYETTVIAQVLDGETAVTEYEPGKTYTFKLTVNTDNGVPAAFGFQAVALTGEDNVNAGSFGVAALPARITLLNSRQYFEHFEPSTQNNWSIEWTAPVAGTGDVFFYAAGNAVNRNNSTSGDEPDLLDEPLVLTESVVSSVFAVATLDLEMTVFPNPVRDLLNLRIRGTENGRFQLRLFDAGGRLLRSTPVEVTGGRAEQQLAVEELPGGLYFLQLSDGQRVKGMVVRKQ